MIGSSQNPQLNKEICELIGAFIGDGYLGNYGKYKSQYLLGFSGDKILDEDYFKNYLAPLIKRNFPSSHPKLYYRKDEGTIVLRLYSKEIHAFFIKLGFNNGIKSRIIRIPDKILTNKNFMNSTVRGIFDTDGCVFFDKRKLYTKPYPRITLQSSSIQLLIQLESYLSRYFKLYLNKNNRDGYRNYIEIYGHKQLETFLKLIGFSNKRHLDKIKNMPL